MTTPIPTSGACRSTPRRFPTASLAEDFVLTLWTADPALARRADAAGIQRVGVDLERFGKAARQQGLGTWISPHTEDDLATVGRGLRRAQLFARVNPLNADSPREVDAVLALGVRVLMLPMVASAAEAARFVALVRGRASVVLLIECRAALDALTDLVGLLGVHEWHVGLNDLALSLGLPNRWLVLAGDVVAEVGSRARAAGVRFGLGGIGRAGDRRLPIPADLVYAEYARTGATSALISRSFLRDDNADLAVDIERARLRLAAWRQRSPADLAAAHRELRRHAERAPAW
jgi:hypothetical protein